MLGITELYQQLLSYSFRSESRYFLSLGYILTFIYSVLPGIAFSLDLIETTEQYGVAEVLISSFMAAFIFSIFGAQPLTIAGVTGGLDLLNEIDEY